MAHPTLVPQPYEKSDKKYDCDTISKKFGTIQGSAKIHLLCRKLHLHVLLIDYPHKTSSMHHYLSEQAKNICLIRHVGKNCADKNIINASPTVEQFLNFFTEFFSQGVSHSVLISAKKCTSTST